jgi:hypothetical protein
MIDGVPERAASVSGPAVTVPPASLSAKQLQSGMTSRRGITALLFVQLLAFAASAQQSAEFGRASGGEIVVTPKRPARFSGSLGLSLASGNDVFGRGSSPGYGVTAGGTLVEDRLWFFASASQQEASSSRFADLALPENATTGAAGARVDGQLGGSQDFSAFFEAARRPQLSTAAPATFAGSVPSSFLSLHYTGVVSSNAFFSASFTRSARTAPGVFSGD